MQIDPKFLGEMFTYTVIPIDLENWPETAANSLQVLLRVVRRFLITGEIHFFSDFPKHHEDVLQYVSNFVSRGFPEHRDLVFGDFYQEFHIKAESVPVLPWRWRWADVKVTLSSALWPGTVQVRGSRETLGKGSLSEKAALVIANQVQYQALPCCPLFLPRSPLMAVSKALKSLAA